jgi:hypothetical protein
MITAIISFLLPILRLLLPMLLQREVKADEIIVDDNVADAWRNVERL